MAGNQSGTKLRRPEGGKIFSRLASLGSHLYIHGEGDNPACPQRGKDFPPEKALQQHTVVQCPDREDDQLVRARETDPQQGL